MSIACGLHLPRLLLIKLFVQFSLKYSQFNDSISFHCSLQEVRKFFYFETGEG